MRQYEMKCEIVGSILMIYDLTGGTSACADSYSQPSRCYGSSQQCD